MSFWSKFNVFNPNPLNSHKKELDKINAYRAEVSALSEEAIKAEIQGFKDQLKSLNNNPAIYKKLVEIRPRVFALVREASKRSIAKEHYDVQLVGGIVLSEGKIAEMKTGEGKTLTATLPLVLFALAGKGAHLVTVNDYLARWQASLMGPLFHYLGLSVASIQHEHSFYYDPEYQPEEEEIKQIEGEVEGLVLDVKHMRSVSRPQAYRADITYGTNNEFGFDYLRDNMVQHADQIAQRELFFSIVDEVDSILIDEARTPLIISAPDTEPTSKYIEFSKLVSQLQEEKDYKVDEKHKATALTDDGINTIEKLLGVDNIYDTSKGVTTIHHIEQALKAKTLFKLDRDYVIRNDEIVIVDEFTGRLMFGRRYNQGLHQAIEAKEGVKIQQESKTLATITFQNLFRLYFKLAGMTGTAKTEEEEFFKIYQLEVAQIPTNKPMVRIDKSDVVYKTEQAKFKAIAKEVKERHKKGQPVLIGTVSIAKNELLAEFLKSEGLKFEILNAKNHEREAHIISQAGRLNSITVATNIAGRGVDILLGGNPQDVEEEKAVVAAGGLCIIGTERHESRRIDNQLRGRAGRQGDPGQSQFFVSMEDDLMRLFGGDRMKNMMTSFGIGDDEPIEAKLVSRSIESAQKKIEGINFDTRKSVLEFDDVLNRQRNIIYLRRRRYLDIQNQEVGRSTLTEELSGSDSKRSKNQGDVSQNPIKDEILDLMKQEMTEIVKASFGVLETSEAAIKQILEAAILVMPVTDNLKAQIEEANKNAADKEFAIIDALSKSAKEYFEFKETEIGFENYRGICKFIILQAIDTYWMEHLDTMDHLRDSVRLRGYGQRDPIVEYKREGFALFERMIKEINKQIVYSVLKVSVQVQQVREQTQAPIQMVTNLSDGSTSLTTGGSTNGSIASNPDLVAQMGRNDPCNCGSGKKFKKCGMLNTAEHQSRMVGK